MKRTLYNVFAICVIVASSFIAFPAVAEDTYNWTGMDVNFKGKFVGTCVVVSEGDAVLGWGQMGSDGVAYDLENWFYPGGYMAKDVDARGVLTAMWDDTTGRHILSLMLEAVGLPDGQMEGWVNEASHFAATNLRYSGRHTVGFRTEFVSGIANGAGPYTGIRPESLVAPLALIPDGAAVASMLVFWSMTDETVTKGQVINGVEMPKDCALPAADVFRYQVLPI